MVDQFLGLLFLLKSVFLVEAGGGKIPGALHRTPLSLKRKLRGWPLGLTAFSDRDRADHPVEGRLHKLPDLPLPAHHHTLDTGHDPAHGNDRIFSPQVVGNAVSVL